MFVLEKKIGSLFIFKYGKWTSEKVSISSNAVVNYL